MLNREIAILLKSFSMSFDALLVLEKLDFLNKTFRIFKFSQLLDNHKLPYLLGRTKFFIVNLWFKYLKGGLHYGNQIEKKLVFCIAYTPTVLFHVCNSFLHYNSKNLNYIRALSFLQYWSELYFLLE